MQRLQEDKKEGSATEDREPITSVPPHNENGEYIEGKNIIASLRRVFSWQNYVVYLLTSWTFNALMTLGNFFNLYLRNLGWEYILIGAVASITGVVAALSRLGGGYIGDNYDRRKLSVVAMAMYALYYLLIGITDSFIIVFVSLNIFALTNLAKGGSTAFIMDSIPKKDSGFALSLFNAGKALGVITLLVFSALIPVFGFVESFRILYLFTGISLLICAIIRDRLLLPAEENGTRERASSLFRDFMQENAKAVRQLLSVIPGVILIVIIDALSDDMFHFGALIYSNEIIGVSISGITIIVLVSLLLSAPLVLKVGRMSDRIGIKKAGIAVYTLMPVSVFLLVLASFVTFWGPIELYALAESLWPGLGTIFTVPFVAIVMKNVNDLLWWVLLITMVQKSLPRTDTAKMLACFWFTVYAVRAIGPLVAGFIFQYSSPVFLFVIIFFMNLLILGLIHRGALNINGEEKPETESKET